MAKEDLTIYDKIEKYLYEDKDKAALVLTETEMAVKERIMLCVSKKLSEPMISDKSLVNFLKSGCDGTIKSVSDSQAYRDVAALTKIVGNVQLASKNWYRYQIVEGAKEGFEIAKVAKDAKGIAACLDKIGKYTRADKEDDDFDFSQMIPPSMEPTDDVSVLEGIEPIEDLETVRNEFRNLFKKDLLKRATEVKAE